MKVLNLITGLDGGGAERMLLRLATAMRADGHESVVVSIIASGTLRDQFLREDIRVETLRVPRGIADPRALLRFMRIVRREKPDIIQTWLYHSDFLGTIAHLAGLRGTPLLWNIRSGAFDTRLYSKTLTIARRTLAALSRVPAAIICNSAAARDEHVAIGYTGDRWRIIPNGIDTIRFRPCFERQKELRHELAIPGDASVVGIVGRVDPLKDYTTFLDAAVVVRKERPSARFVMVGHGLSYANEAFASMVTERALRDHVILLGEKGDVSKVYPAFDICCLSSCSESFPNVLAEALACAVPCVTTDVGGASEIVGAEGKVVPPRNASALASALIEMLDISTEERRQLGLRGRARIERDYSLPAVAARYEQLYREITAVQR